MLCFSLIVLLGVSSMQVCSPTVRDCNIVPLLRRKNEVDTKKSIMIDEGTVLGTHATTRI